MTRLFYTLNLYMYMILDYQIIDNSTLRMLKTDVSDSGIYICIARNNAGTAIGQVRLQVSGRIYTKVQCGWIR